MVEPQYQEKVLGEVSLNFFIRSVEVEGRHDFYFKLYVRIKDDKNGTEIDQQFLSPEEYETHRILGATGYSCVRKYVSRRLKVFIKTHLEP
ncbi:hypothetical protein [Sulfolobus spindle-shaped virus]|nr:hypothetical protein [Sulfolobus spindle-shaped virus]